MRIRAWAVPILLLGCQALDPTRATREAARELRFRLQRVEPGVELALPLERSRLRLRIRVEVENPSTHRFDLRSFEGDLRLERDGASLPVGRVTTAHPVDLAPGGRADVDVEAVFGYGDLKDRWAALREALAGRGAWTLEGRARTRVLGLEIEVPVRTRLSREEAP